MDSQNSGNKYVSQCISGVLFFLALLSMFGCGDQPDTLRLNSLTVTPGSLSIPLGQTAQLKVTGLFNNGVSENATNSVIWQSMNPGVVTVSSDGLVASVAVGTTKVIANKSGVIAATTVVVSKAALQAVSLSPPPSSITLGQTAQLVATGTFTDKTTQDLTDLVSWSASQPSVATVSATGVVTSRAVGSTAVTASLGDISASGQITVSQALLAAIVVRSKDAVSPLGTNEQFTATGAYTDGSTADLTGIVSWTSSPAGIVSINSAGMASTKATGNTTITATSGALSGTGSLTVSPAALVSINLGSSPPSIPLGNSQQLSAKGTYTDGSTQDLTTSVHWVSSSPGIVAINATGLAIAKSVGTAGVSATSSSITGTQSLSVSSAVLTAISISPVNPTLPLGSSQQLSAVGTYTDGTSRPLISSVTWNSLSPGVVAISTTGLAAAKSIGTAGISATSGNITGAGNLNVSAAALASITISTATPTLPLGSSQQLSATGTFTNGGTQDLTNSVNWASSSPGIITILSTGLATAKSVGTAGVSATSGKIAAVESLSVSPAALTSISISPIDPTVPLGTSVQLSATGRYTDGSTQDVTSQIAWSIDKPDVAKISVGGLATAQQVGTTAIQASLNDQQASGTLTVQPLLSVAYFDATSGVDSSLHITNPAVSGQNLCAMVYVFDQDQQMSECCGCQISQDGLRTLSLSKDLLSNPLTGVLSTAGTVMLVTADLVSNPTCNASVITPSGTAVAWSTHIQKLTSGQLSSAEDPFSSSPLSTTLSSALQAQCSFIQQLGSGQGQCGCGSGH